MTLTTTLPAGGANDDARATARSNAEKTILGLQLQSAPGAQNIVRDELGEDWRRFEPLHVTIQEAIATEQARGDRFLSMTRVLERLRPRVDPALNIRAYLVSLANRNWADDGDAGEQMRAAIRVWRGASNDAPPHEPSTPTANSRKKENTQSSDLARVKEATAALDGYEALLSRTRAKKTPPERKVFLRRANDVTPQKVRWLWEGWLAQGKLHLLAGQAGTGKTTLALSLAATLSRGGLFPDGSRAPQGSTILWSGEDDLANSLLPRYLASGGDPAMLLDLSFAASVGGIRHAFDPATDFPTLVHVAARFGNVKLVIVDPIVSATGAGINNGQTRKALRPLVDFAEATGAAILGITHFAKATRGRDASERVIGSTAFHAMARAVWTTAMPAITDAPFRLVRAKSNIGPARDGFEYCLVRGAVDVSGGETFEAQTIAWGEPVFGHPQTLLAEIERAEEENVSALARAKAWLAERLKDGAVPARRIEREAEAQGFGWRTLKRAKSELGAYSIKNGAEGGWAWVLGPDGKEANCEDDVAVGPLGLADQNAA